MFDIGFGELLIIFVVALLVVGPEQLPTLARKVGLYVGRLKRSFNQIKHDVEQELEIEAVKAKLKENALLAEAKELEESLKNAEKALDDADQEVKTKSEKRIGKS